MQVKASPGDAPNGVRKARRGRRRKRAAARRERGGDESAQADAELGELILGPDRESIRPARRSLGLGPEITLGESPREPTRIPNPPGQGATDGPSPNMDSGSFGATSGDALDVDAETLDAPPPLTADGLVETCQQAQYVAGMLYAMSVEREWSAAAIEACTYSAAQRAQLATFAPQVLPFVQWITESKLIGVGMFCSALVMAGAQSFAKIRSLPLVPKAVDVEPGEPHAEEDEPGARNGGEEAPPRWQQERSEFFRELG